MSAPSWRRKSDQRKTNRRRQFDRIQKRDRAVAKFLERSELYLVGDRPQTLDEFKAIYFAACRDCGRKLGVLGFARHAYTNYDAILDDAVRSYGFVAAGLNAPLRQRANQLAKQYLRSIDALEFMRDQCRYETENRRKK
jgi:hypothetical protein